MSRVTSCVFVLTVEQHRAWSVFSSHLLFFFLSYFASTARKAGSEIEHERAEGLLMIKLILMTRVSFNSIFFLKMILKISTKNPNEFFFPPRTTGHLVENAHLTFPTAAIWLFFMSTNNSSSAHIPQVDRV